MSNTVITIKNFTDYTFTMDTAMSSGTTGPWPSTINPGTTAVPWNFDFDQSWSTQIKFNAWYNVQGSGNNEKIEMHFYADGVEVFSKSFSTQPDGIFEGSSAQSSGHKAVTFNIEGVDTVGGA